MKKTRAKVIVRHTTYTIVLVEVDTEDDAVPLTVTDAIYNVERESW